jgi:hypothetical protein
MKGLVKYVDTKHAFFSLYLFACQKSSNQAVVRNPIYGKLSKNKIWYVLFTDLKPIVHHSDYLTFKVQNITNKKQQTKKTQKNK